MSIRILLLKCPKCGQKMKYQPQGALGASSRKRCVFCGASFKVVDRMLKVL